MTHPEDRISTLSDARRALLAQWTATVEPPRTPTEILLAAIWRDVLAVEAVQATQSFLELGGDSISSLQAVARASQHGLRVTSRQMIEALDLRTLAKALERPVTTVVGHDDDIATGEIGLTPIQRWFFEQELHDSHFWDQAILVSVEPAVDAVILSRALDDLLKHHDVLRSRFRRVAGEWSEHVPETAPSVPVVISTDDQTEAIAAAQHLIDLESGRLMAAALINGSDGRPAQLLLVIHHLVVDGVSIRVLLEDLESAYRGRVEGVALILPPRTTSFRRWAHSLLTFARTAQVQRQIDYWRSVPDEAAATIPTGLVMRNDNIPAPASLTLELPADLTERLVRDLPRTRGVSAQHLFLAAFLLTWQRLTGCLELQLDLEGHGREPIDDVSDVSRTVGWFTTIYPVRFALSADPGIILDGVRRRLDEVPDHGIGYGLLRYLSNDSCLADLPQSAIAFNYLGRFERSSADDRVFGIPLEAPKILHSDHVVGRYALELIVTVVADRLLLEVRYRRDKFDETTIRSLLYGNAAALRELVDVLSGAIRATGDFPLAKLTPGQLDLVRQQVGDGR